VVLEKNPAESNVAFIAESGWSTSRLPHGMSDVYLLHLRGYYRFYGTVLRHSRRRVGDSCCCETE
jgi:hypothetical protein